MPLRSLFFLHLLLLGCLWLPCPPARALQDDAPRLDDKFKDPGRVKQVGAEDNPVPQAAAVKSARRDLRRVYRDQYADKSDAGRAALAEQLILDAKGSGDLTVEFAMYEEAADLATQVGAAQIALNAISATELRFAVDEQVINKMRIDALIRLSSQAKSADEVRAVMQTSVDLIGQLIALEQFESAFKIVSFLKPLDSKLRNTVYEYHYDPVLARWQRWETSWRRVRISARALAEKPDDPRANEAMGKFYCFDLGLWEKGLPMLARSANPVYKNLALSELSNPSGGDDCAAIGDGWYDLAFQRPDRPDATVAARARMWYERAEPNVAGIVKLNVKRKLEELAKFRTVSDVLATLNEAQRNRAIRYRDKLFLAKSEPLAFEAANEWCQSLGGTLATVREGKENTLIARVVADYIDPKTGYKYWIGGVRQSGGWSWVDKSSSNYTAWRGDQPNNAGGNQNAIACMADGSWGDESGEETLPFVAQWYVAE